MYLSLKRLLLSTVFVLSSVTLYSDATETDAEKDQTAISYWRDVRPIFQAHCQGCHQPAKPGGEYVMTSFDTMIDGGESGDAAIKPGDPSASYLVEQIIPVDGKAEMPKGAPPLSESDISTITKWISAGADDDTPESAKKTYDAEHPPIYSAAPVITAIDFSSDGKWMALSGYHEVLLFDANKLLAGEDALLHRLVGMSERIESVSFFSQQPKVGGCRRLSRTPWRNPSLGRWIGKFKLFDSCVVRYDLRRELVTRR